MCKDKATKQEGEWSESKKWRLGLLSQILGTLISLLLGILFTLYLFQQQTQRVAIRDATTIQRITNQNQLIYDTISELAETSTSYQLDLGPYLFGEGNPYDRKETGPYGPYFKSIKSLESELIAVMDSKYEPRIIEIFEPLLCSCTLHHSLNAGEVDRHGHSGNCGHLKYSGLKQGILKTIHNEISSEAFDRNDKDTEKNEEITELRSKKGKEWTSTLSQIVSDVTKDLYDLAEQNVNDNMN